MKKIRSNNHGFIPLLLIIASALVIFGTAGIFILADSAKPGDPLFALDQTIEKVQLSLTTSPQSRAKLESSLALERATELEQAVQANNKESVNKAIKAQIEKVNDSVEETQLIEQDITLEQTNEIVENVEKQNAIVNSLYTSATEEEKSLLFEAKENSDTAVISTYLRLKNRLKEEKTVGNEGSVVSTASVPSITFKTDQSCSKNTTDNKNVFHAKISAQTKNMNSESVVLSITDTISEKTAYFAILRNGFVSIEVSAQDDIGSILGTLFRLELIPDGREYKLKALRVKDLSKFETDLSLHQIIAEHSFSKNCSEPEDEQQTNSATTTETATPTPFPTPTSTPTQSSAVTAGKVILALSPDSATINRGCQATFSVNLDTAGKSVDGTDILLNFNPEIFSINTTDITKGEIFNEYLFNTRNLPPGRSDISGLAPINKPFSGKGTVATYKFKVLPTAKLGQTEITFEYDSSNPTKTTDTNVAEHKTSNEVLQSVTNGKYLIAEGNCSQ